MQVVAAQGTVDVAILQKNAKVLGVAHFHGRLGLFRRFHPSYYLDMTLRRKMGLQIAAMIGGLLLVSGAAFWGLDAVHEDYGLAAAGYRELRQVYEVGSHLAAAKLLLMPGRPDRAGAAAEVERAAERFELLIHPASAEPGQRVEKDPAAEAAVRAALADAQRQLNSPAQQFIEEDILAADGRAVSGAIGKISDLASGIRAAIEAHQRSAIHTHALATRTVAGVSAAIIFASIVLGIMQYRGVIKPLGTLRWGVRKMAAGQFAERLTLRGGEEFVELAGEFNRMAGELDGFYHLLEQKVAQKSKELIQSERLASVGYLAAGVAHEINNPLSIISGYAEHSLQQLKQQALTHGNEDVARSLSIICEEAFRCKDITAKLLSLSRQGEQTRQDVCLADVAEQVASIVGGLREYHDRRLEVALPGGSTDADRQRLRVSAVEAEMKQVVLNLTLNALEASPAPGGQVRIEISRSGENVELAVIDNGRGMSPATLERVFEPFYTEKRGSRSHGTGLGLSITHAIVQSHGGSIRAQSDGEAKGSRFTVTLPAAS